MLEGLAVAARGGRVHRAVQRFGVQAERARQRTRERIAEPVERRHGSDRRQRHGQRTGHEQADVGVVAVGQLPHRQQFDERVGLQRGHDRRAAGRRGVVESGDGIRRS